MTDDCRVGIRPECAVELREIHSELRMIRKAVIGNGDGDKGLIARVSRNSLALKIIGVAVTIIVPILLAMILAGCGSPTKQLAANLTDAQAALVMASKSVESARTATEQAKAILTTDSPAQAPLTAVLGHLEAAKGHIGTVRKAATAAQKTLPGVKDPEGTDWAGLGKLAAAVALMWGVLYALAKFGVFPVVKAIFRRIAAKIAPAPDPPPLPAPEPVAEPPPAT